jgi:predicted esterase
MKSTVIRLGSALFGICCLVHTTTHVSAKQTNDEPQPGQLTERVICKDAPTQTYALYLPSGYTPTRKWPLVAAFDPAARGKAPVERFKDAAERYGYVVCGSNNSRNGPIQPSAEAAKAMLADVAARFSIDSKQVYLAGFSGGARAATTIAVWLSGQIAGVIGCGAGLAVGLEPKASLPFIFYGTVGTEDFNYPELKQLDRALQSAGIVHRVEVFEGGHDWAPSDVCVRAIEWLELQSMKSGHRARDDEFINRAFNSAQTRATELESSGRIYEAFLAYVAMTTDFSGLKDSGEAQKKSEALKDSKAVKQAVNRDRELESEQSRRVNELFGLRAKLMSSASDAPNASEQSAYGSGGADTGSRQLAFSDLRGKLADLKHKSEAKDASSERALARRIFNQYTIAEFENSMSLIQTKKYDLAAANLSVDSELMPDNPRLLYYLACAFSLKGDKRRAVDALNKAVQKGFSNVAELERNDQLDAIRSEEGFKKILEGLRNR